MSSIVNILTVLESLTLKENIFLKSTVSIDHL